MHAALLRALRAVACYSRYEMRSARVRARRRYIRRLYYVCADVARVAHVATYVCAESYAVQAECERYAAHALCRLRSGVSVRVPELMAKDITSYAQRAARAWRACHA